MSTTTCIVTCFNYENFVKEAIFSAQSQTVKFDEIIVVDDASSDASPSIIDKLKSDIPNLRVVRHPKNKGQLAAFESGINESKGDFIFLLDADDVYAPRYLERSLAAYRHHPNCEFLFCHRINFDGQVPLDLFAVPDDRELHPSVTDLGFSVIRTLEDKIWIGAPTSCLSFRRSLAEKLFPLPLHEDWRIRADDCIVFGASIAGCRKFRLEEKLVGYRIHGNNAWANNKRMDEPGVFFRYQLSIVRLCNLLSDRFWVGKNIAKIAQYEFKTIPSPSLHDVFTYSKFIVENGAGPSNRFFAIGVLYKWYFRSRHLAYKARKELNARRTSPD